MSSLQITLIPESVTFQLPLQFSHVEPNKYYAALAKQWLIYDWAWMTKQVFECNLEKYSNQQVNRPGISMVGCSSLISFKIIFWSSKMIRTTKAFIFGRDLWVLDLILCYFLCERAKKIHSISEELDWLSTCSLEYFFDKYPITFFIGKLMNHICSKMFINNFRKLPLKNFLEIMV